MAMTLLSPSPKHFEKSMASRLQRLVMGVSLKAFPRITFHLSLKGDKEMDYRIVEKEAFTVIGKSIRVTCQDGEHTRQIPKFWEKCHRNGTIAKLASIGTGENLLGICL